MFDLTLRGNLLFFVPLAVVLIILGINYFQLLRKHLNVIRVIVWCARAAVLILTILLVSDPFVQYDNVEDTDPVITVIIDNSQSMGYNTLLESSDFNAETEILINQLKGISKNVRLYTIGADITPVENISDLSFEDSITDFSQLPEFVNNVHSRYNFLITDGVATAGIRPGDLTFQNKARVFPIGVGNDAGMNDIEIKSVSHPFTIISSDTLDMTVKIQHKSDKDQTRTIRVVDSTGDELFSSSLRINKGQGFIEVPVSIPASKITPPLTVTILPEKDEFQIENNSYSMDITILSDNEEILLVSGALSNNTHLIKSILREIPRSNIDHHFRINNQNWNRSVSDQDIKRANLVILDNFPVFTGDQELFNRIKVSAGDYRTPIIFFEGPNSNNITRNLISNLAGIQATVGKNHTPQNMSVTDAGRIFFDTSYMEKLPPAISINNWTADSDAVELQFEDGSAALVRIKKPHGFIGIFLADLNSIHLKLSQTEVPQYITGGLKSLILSELFSTDQLVNSGTEKSSYDFGEQVGIKTRYNQEFISKPSRVRYVLKDLEGVVVKEIPARFNFDSKRFNADFTPPDIGSFIIETLSGWDDSTMTVSDTTRITVQETGIEFRDLTLNRKELLEIAENTEGRYFELNEQDIIMKELTFKRDKTREQIRFSMLSTHRYWWIIIVLLTIEWVLRKRIGLL